MRKRFCVGVIAVALLFTGCTSVPNMSRINNDMEAEYIAGTLLKYDANYDGGLEYDRNLLNATPSPKPTPSPVASPSELSSEDDNSVTSQGAISQPQSYVSLESMAPMKGILLSQETHELKKSYGSDFATVEAEKGKKLLIVKFRIKNTTSKKQKVNMNKKELSYVLEIDGETVGSPLHTIVQGDIQYFNTGIPAGKSKEAVLLFELPDSQKLKNATLYISDGKQTAQVSVK